MKITHSAFILMLAIGGCTTTSTTMPAFEAEDSLAKGAGVLVAVPKDGGYRNDVAVGSGMSVANAALAALTPYSPNSTIADGDLTLDQLFTEAKAAGQRYIFQTEILNWEDRATEWSGKSDVVRLRMTFWDVDTRKVLLRQVGEARSKWMTMGGDHPEDIASVPIEKFVGEAF